MIAFAIATFTVVSCDKKATEAVQAKDSTKQENHEGHDHAAGEAHKIAYVCPMDCEKGKTYEAKGKCPKCSMDLIEQKHTEGDGHDHSKTKELTPEEKEQGHSHGEEGHDH